MDRDAPHSHCRCRIGHCETITGDERLREGSVFFASERCAFDVQGFMERGVADGERAAVGMLATLRLNNPR